MSDAELASMAERHRFDDKNRCEDLAMCCGNVPGVAQLSAAERKVEELRAALKDLRVAVVFKTPTVEFGAGNPCYEARVPIGFIDRVDAALRASEEK